MLHLALKAALYLLVWPTAQLLRQGAVTWRALICQPKEMVVAVLPMQTMQAMQNQRARSKGLAPHWPQACGHHRAARRLAS